MTDKEKIRAEVERLKNIADENSFKWNDSARAAWRQQSWVCGEILNFIDSLPEETNPIPSPDEAMKILDEKIALRKKNGSWEGTDAENCGRYIEEDSK